MKTKLLIAAVSLVMLAGFTAATTNYDGPTDQPHIMEQPNDTGQPGDVGPGNRTLLDLPSQASDRAREVLSGISEAFNRGLDNLGQSISNLISMN